MLIMSSVTCSCLESLELFFEEERENAYTEDWDSYSDTSSMSLVEMMCHERIIDSILMSASYLSRGLGRLATMRIIRALSEWPDALTALYEGNIVDVLMLISSEAGEHKTRRGAGEPLSELSPQNANSFNSIGQFSNHGEGRDRDGRDGRGGQVTIDASLHTFPHHPSHSLLPPDVPGPGPLRMHHRRGMSRDLSEGSPHHAPLVIAKPGPVERSVSGASDVSSSISNASFYSMSQASFFKGRSGK